jgi:hypothetical protein
MSKLFCTSAVLLIVLLLVLPFVSSAAFSEARPNELGKVPILEYHLIQAQPSVWARTARDFRADLEMLYNAGYRALGLSDYLAGTIGIPAGTHPVIFTFDDSSPGQFRYIVRNGKKEIDPDCAVGIFLDFRKKHPDFGMKASFFVLPGAAEPHRLFGQPEFEKDKLRQLVELGFEIGNHTLWHANLKKYDSETVRKQLAKAVEAIQEAVPGYNVHTLSLPFGVYPKHPDLAVSGSYGNTSYHNDGILEVSGGSDPSPFSLKLDPLHLTRTQVTGKSLERLIRYFEKHPEEIFVSDGKVDNVTFPASLRPEFSAGRYKNLKAKAY